MATTWPTCALPAQPAAWTAHDLVVDSAAQLFANSKTFQYVVTQWAKHNMSLTKMTQLAYYKLCTCECAKCSVCTSVCRLTHVLWWQSSNRLVFNNSFALCNARYRSLVRTKALWEKQRKCTPAPERRRRPARLSRLTTFTISAQWNTTHKSNLLSEPSIQLEDVSHSPCPIPRLGDTNGASVSVFYGCAHWGRARIVAYFTARPWNWVVLHSLNKSLDGRLRVMKTWWVRAIVVAAWTCLWIIYILFQIG